MEEDTGPPVRVILSSRVAAKMHDGMPRPNEAERAGLGNPFSTSIEVGGLMMGERLGDRIFRVIDISLTIGEAGRYYLDFAQHQPFIDDFMARFDDRYRFGLIGSWHSHPSGEPTPSECDLQSLKDTLLHPAMTLNFKVLLIVCLNAGAKLRTEGIIMLRGSKTLNKVLIEYD